MISLAINSRFRHRPLTGVERFASEVEKELQKSEALTMRRLDPGRELSGFKGHAWEQFSLASRVKGDEILFSPCNTGPVSVHRQLVVIHDAAVFDYPEGFSRAFGAFYRALLPVLARRAKVVATVSEFSRDRLSRILNLPAERIPVLGNAAGPDFRLADDPPERPEFRLFSVSSLDPRKNFHQLVEAWENLDRAGKLPDGAELRIAGGANPRNFADSGPCQSSRVQWLGRIPDEQLVREYQTASAFVYPSLYEGFGLPPLEAMACGCPVLLSDRSSLPEVGGPEFDGESGAALYFEPDCAKTIEAGIERFLHLDGDQKQKLSSNARERSRAFSWANVAGRVEQKLAEL